MSCTTLLARRWEEVLAPGAKRRFAVDFSDVFSYKRFDKQQYNSGDKIRLDNGFDAECTTPGRIGAVEPRWLKMPGATIQDGGVTWTIAEASSDSLRTIAASLDWTVPTGITLSSQDDGDTATSAELTVSSDAAAGDYTILVAATGADVDAEVIVRPCILQVG